MGISDAADKQEPATRRGLPITPSSPYWQALQALKRGCRDEAERVAHIAFLSAPRGQGGLF